MEGPGSGQWRATANRRARIGDLVLQQGTLAIEEIVERFGVSRMTVHRDLDELERRGVLHKVRGGASARPSTQFESDIRFRMGRESAAKEALSAAALELISPGDSVLVDEATTLLPLVRRLPGLGSLTVISNFIPALRILADQPELRLIALGGEYDPRFATYTGPLCRATVERLRPDLYITSTTAVDAHGAYHPDARIADVKRAMLAVASRGVLLADHTKLGQRALHRVTGPADFDTVICDHTAADAAVRPLREAGAHVTLARAVRGPPAHQEEP